MKIRIHKLLCFPALIASLSLMLTGHATAQIFTTLYSFGTNAADGYHPNGLILSGNTLFGTTLQGGDGYPGAGMVFKINTDGSGFTNLYNFNPGSDGAYPVGSLVLSGNTLYGEANNGGNVAEDGILFSVNTDGSDHANLHFFNPGYGSAVDGGGPVAGLILSDNTLYGMTPYGGIDSNGGIVFKINTDGSSYTNYLHVFSSIAQNSSGFYTNSDGAQPQGALILSGNTLYGTTYIGGSSGNGTIFSVHTDGTGFTNLYTFSATSGPSGTNSDGANPSAGLLLSGNALYGTAEDGGSLGYGTVFKINTDGTDFATLHSFTNGDYADLNDGAYPASSLVISGNTLYGTTAQYRGSNLDALGTVFAVNTDGTGFTTLHNFESGNQSDGFSPQANLILSGITLYGTAAGGGNAGYGTIFSLSLVPSLSITTVGNQAVLSWPTWAPNFVLQTTTNLASPAWTGVSPAPVVFNGQNVVTNSISGAQQFYQLSH